MSTRRDLIGPRVPLNGLTPTGNLARPKTGGRVAGSRNKQEASVEMMADILSVYQQLGGARWLARWAKEHETEFIKQALSRVFPTPPREDPEVVIQNNFTANLSDLEVARRIAFALNSATHAVGAPMAVDSCGGAKMAPIAKPEPVPLSFPPDIPPDFVEQELVRNTREGTLATYHGGAVEQGYSRRRRLL